jgi:hypothetical protein
MAAPTDLRVIDPSFLVTFFRLGRVLQVSIFLKRSLTLSEAVRHLGITKSSWKEELDRLERKCGQCFELHGRNRSGTFTRLGWELAMAGLIAGEAMGILGAPALHPQTREQLLRKGYLHLRQMTADAAAVDREKGGAIGRVPPIDWLLFEHLRPGSPFQLPHDAPVTSQEAGLLGEESPS